MKITVAICFLIIAGFNASAQTRETWTTDDDQSYIVTDKGEKIYGEVTFLFKDMKFKYWSKQETRDLDMTKYAQLLSEAQEKYNQFSDAKSEESALALNALNELKYVPQIGISFSDGKREKEYEPGDLQGFMYGGDVWITTTKREVLKKEDFLVKTQYAPGPIKLLFFVSKTANTEKFPPVTEYNEDVTMQKMDEDEVRPTLWLAIPGTFKKKMSDYVSDYSELSQKVRNEEQGYSMKMVSLIKDAFAGSESPIDRIIKEYNQWHRENN